MQENCYLHRLRSSCLQPQVGCPLGKHGTGYCFFLSGLCKHHAAGLCLSAISKELKVACPAFCLAKLFRGDKFYRRVQLGVKEALKKELHLDKVHDTPDWTPDPEHARFASDILEFAYYRRDLRSVPEELAATLRSQDALRRRRGAELLQMCPGDWRKRRIHPRCAICTTKEEAVEHAI